MPADPDPVVLDLPFRGRWRTENSPARRVPSHGTDLFGVTYAIDFVAVGPGRGGRGVQGQAGQRQAGRGRSAPRSWRSMFWVEPPERFVGFGAPILAPADGTVVAIHDGEPDHQARRSQLALVPYALGQAKRVRAGIAAIAGNHVTVALSSTGPYVTLVHLQSGSIRVRPGQRVSVGEQLACCGNSGNSTEPHVHLQVTDSTDWAVARGLPMVFRRPGTGRPDDARPGDGRHDDRRTGPWLPQEGEVVEVL